MISTLSCIPFVIKTFWKNFQKKLVNMRLFWNKPPRNAITAHALDNGSDFSCACRVSLHTILMQLHSNTPGLFSPKHSNNLKSKSTFWNLSIPDCSIVACRVLVGARTIRERESGGRLQALWSVDCSVPLYLASFHPLLV